VPLQWADTSGEAGREQIIPLSSLESELPFLPQPERVSTGELSQLAFAVIKRVVITMQSVTALALVTRVIIASATRTFFQPDEYFQALEPAHFLVFGYGDLTWEWTSRPPIRSILYPALNVPIYWLLKIFRLDGTFLLVRQFRLLSGSLQ